MFNIGDYIIYGSTGACRVNEITKIDIDGEEKEYYILDPVYQECTISTPIDNTQVPMRPVMSENEVNELIDSIPKINAEAYYNDNFRSLTEHYSDIIKTYDCRNIIELTMSLYQKRRKASASSKKFGATDDRFMKIAEDLLFGEFAIALGTTKEKVMDYIDSRIGDQLVDSAAV